MTTFLHYLRRTVQPSTCAGLTDRQLLARYAAGQGDAFAELVRRHGPMVYSACRRLLRGTEAEDAFQAAFLVLARKAGSAGWQDSVASWLYAVALRTARKARAAAARRQQREGGPLDLALAMSHEPPPPDDTAPLLDEEIQRLPEKYRRPVVLCYLEGRSNEEAARQLHWPVGTVKVRLMRARDLLRRRLERRGVVASAAAGALFLGKSFAPAAPPGAWVDHLLHATDQLAAGATLAASGASAPAVGLAEACLRELFAARVKAGLVVGLLVLAVGLGGGWLASGAATSGPQAGEAAPSRSAPPAAPPVETRGVRDASTRLALGLTTHFRNQPGNVVVAPFGACTALSLLYAGAAPDGAAAMRRELGFDADPGRWHRAFAAQLEQLRDARTGGVTVAVSLWGQKGAAFPPDFLAAARGYYGVELRRVDFHASGAAAGAVNAWIDQQTRRRVGGLKSPRPFPESTTLALVAVTDFNALWDSPFPRAQTRPEGFRPAPGRTEVVPTMHQTQRLRYLDAGTFRALELPYQGRELSMLLVLPRDDDGLAAVERELTPDRLEQVVDRLREQEVQVSLPRFHGDMEVRVSEEPPAGTPRLALGDFSRLTVADARLAVTVCSVTFHLTEDGSETALAPTRPAPAPATVAPLPRAEFRVDHPCLFLVRHHRTGTILYVGRLARPAA